MDRNEFINQIVAILRENEPEHTEDNTAPSTPFIAPMITEYDGSRMPTTVAIVHQAYHAFQYDYPLVDNNHLLALANAFRDHANHTKCNQFSTYVTTKLLEGILYQNEYNSRNPTSISHCNLVAASVLLIHFNDILQKGPKEANRLLHKLHIQTPIHPTVNGTPSNEQPSEHRISLQKLHHIASITISALFHHVPPPIWKEWDLYIVLEDIIKTLLCTEANDEAEKLLYGVEGEWKRYLFITRDHILNAPHTLLMEGLRSLKHLYASFCSGPESLAISNPTAWRIVSNAFLTVFADLCASEKFASRLDQTHQPTGDKKALALVQLIDELLPTLVSQLAMIQECDALTTLGVQFSQSSELSIQLSLQLLRYQMTAGILPSSRQKIAKRYLECGLVRSLARLWPTRDQFQTNSTCSWQRDLLEWLAECCACYSEIAVYTSQLPGVMSTLEMMESTMLAPYVVVAFATKVQEERILDVSALCCWLQTQLEKLFPMKCKSFLDAINQMKDAEFVLKNLQTAVLSAPHKLVTIVCKSVSEIVYPRLQSAFEHPTISKEKMENPLKAETEKSQAEIIQSRATRNRLRLRVKNLLILNDPDSKGMHHSTSGLTSKLD